jgi:hypothetical protein
MKVHSGILFLLLLAGLSACAPGFIVKPLKKGEHAVSAHLGGPLITFAGLPIPVPLSGIDYHYGLSNKLSLGGGLGLTSLAFGTAQCHLGSTIGILKEDNSLKTGLSAVVKTHFLLDRWEGNFRFYPEAGFHACKQTGKQRFYAGGSAWIETNYARKRSSDNFWVPMLHAGWQRAGEKWQPSVEFKWIAPGQDSRDLVVDYIAPGGKGSFGLYFGLSRFF